MTSISIPEGLTSINHSTFEDCSSLTSISIPDGVTSIGSGAFEDCSSLTSIHIPEGVTSIGEEAFEGCRNLASINIPDGVTSIGNSTFKYCNALTSIHIPDSVTSIGTYAFDCCSSLKSINIPDKVTSIGYSAFYNYIKEVNINSIENWMMINMSEKAFNSGYDIIVNGLKLTDLVVPESIVTIGQYSFKNCKSIESITLHKDVSAIAQNAFAGCTNVKNIICQGDTPPICGTDALSGISRTDCVLYVPETSGSNYQNTAPWNEFTNIVGGGTDTPDTPNTCEAPAITFDSSTKKLVFTSTTEGAEYHYTITSDDINTSEKSASEATMTGVYTITAYASAEGMYNSEKTTAKLCWVSGAIEDTGVLNANADRGVIVSSNGNQINISGTVGGETIELYNMGGSKIKEIKASDGNTVISGLQSGNAYIVKIGGTKVKVAM